MALITCRGLAFAYGAETVLSGVDFAVEAGTTSASWARTAAANRRW